MIQVQTRNQVRSLQKRL